MLPVISEPMAWITYFVIGVAVLMALTIALKMMRKDKGVPTEA